MVDPPQDQAPTPFRQFVVKMHSRCNLACTYCYLYTMADQRWRHRPTVISDRIIQHTATRIATHALTHNLPEVSVVLHGGEPLLAGRQRLGHAVATIRSTLSELAPRTRVRFSLQTNGTLLTPDHLTLFDAYDVRVGVSLDGPAASHDRSRPARHGSSHARVVRALENLRQPEFQHLFSGLLCVIDVTQDPLATYDALVAFDPPSIDLLLPHHTWSDPPAAAPGAHADWLIQIFDRWFHAPVRRTRIRLFEEIINVLLGGASGIEGIGTTPAVMIVVETDGQIEQSDILAATYEGAASLGLNVLHHDFDAALLHPSTIARQLGPSGVPTPCRPCRWSTTCGGGLHPHRYRPDSGFDHPSVYCTDLDRLFTHIHATLTDALTTRLATREQTTRQTR